MNRIRLIKGALAAAAAFAAGAVLAATAAPAKRAGNWLATVTRTPEAGYVLGNPVAPVKLVEYISYTCPHCAHFEIEAGDQLKLGMVANGKGSVEFRSFLRNPIDVAATLLVQCGATSRFIGNHNAFLRAQEKWLVNAQLAGPAQQQRWMTGDFASRMRAISTDMGFYEIMEGRGYQRPVLDKCLANEALANLVATGTNNAVTKDKVKGTPSFLINGQLQEDVHDWSKLRPKLMPLTR